MSPAHQPFIRDVPHKIHLVDGTVYSATARPDLTKSPFGVGFVPTEKRTRHGSVFMDVGYHFIPWHRIALITSEES